VSRSTTVEYSTDGKFPVKTTNALGHSETKTTHLSNHLNQQNCFLSSTAKNLRYFTKNKPSFCQNKKIVANVLVVNHHSTGKIFGFHKRS
jgi:hypothetical protein